MGYTGKREVDPKELQEKKPPHMLVGPVTLAITIFVFILIAILTITGCASIKFSLPDRDHPACQVPYSQRPTCLSDTDCAQNYLCAFRGGFTSVEGRCTYIDCCDPWRNRRLEGGRTFCDIDINPSVPAGRKPVRNEP